jgi:hypothetical protein
MEAIKKQTLKVISVKMAKDTANSQALLRLERESGGSCLIETGKVPSLPIHSSIQPLNIGFLVKA